MHLKNQNEFNTDFLRYMILNSLRSYNMKLFKGRGEIVIACDSKDNWRKDIFQYYKASRKTDREKSKINWEEIFKAFDTVKSELKEYFPYTVIDVHRAEADDIIAVLAKNGGKTLILSGDTDFVQLHDNFLIEQYNPVRKKFVTIPHPELYLKEHIIEGDVSDGVPNIRSADDTFVLGNRQKRLTKNIKDYLIKTDPSLYPAVEKRNYERNKTLIDLTCIPEEIKLNINDEYNNKPTKNKSKLFNYFYDRKLIKFIDNLQEF